MKEEAIQGLKRNLAEALRERDSYCGHMMRLDRERSEFVELYEWAEKARLEMQAHAERLQSERDEVTALADRLQSELEAARKQVELLRSHQSGTDCERSAPAPESGPQA